MVWLALWMYDGGSGGRLAFSSLVGSSLLLSAVECHHFSNGYHSEKGRDMSQAALAAFKFTGFVFVIVRHNSRDVFADHA